MDPYYDNGSIRLREVKYLAKIRTGYTSGASVAALAENLSKDFSYGVMADAKKILEEQRDKAQFRQQMLSFNVRQIRVTEDAMVLTLDFVLDVK